ncbi:MAG: DUF5683 domain-containing protein [Bacteroidales bacterium]|nr:DUF5683 domain-containing protein [Bacteroidales bacterium]MDY6001918.1 DUF5683 domain-containing protein [Candidatus Cryptobacteroides sp.]
MKGSFLKIFTILALLFAFSMQSHAQFREEAFNQSYNDPSDTTSAKDSVAQMWTFREFFRGITHKDTLRIGSMFAGATVFIGAEQIYNKQYWKLPIIYGGLGATIGLGIHYNKQFKDSGNQHDKDMSKYMFASAGFLYWATLMDGVYNYRRDVPHQPGKATIYSILVPGLGQAYNGEYWKIPIYWGFMIGSYHFWDQNRTNYKKYKRIHNLATTKDSGYDGRITAEQALYYRNVFRRYRDYSVVAFIGSYLLQIIDANVFAYLQDFEVSDNLSMKISPTIISPYNEYAFDARGPANFGTPMYGIDAIGLKVGFTF